MEIWAMHQYWSCITSRYPWGHFQFFLHLKIKLRFCVFSSWLHLLLFHCYSCQTHFWNHEQQWETWNFKFSCWYLWSYRRCCGKSWKQSHTKLFEKMSHGWRLADVFPDPPSSASLTAYVFIHYVYLFVYFFIGTELSCINKKVNT